MKTVEVKMPENTVINENYVAEGHPPLQKKISAKKVVPLQEVKFPTKKFRMRSLLWVKPTGVAVASTSSLLAQVCSIVFKKCLFLRCGNGNLTISLDTTFCVYFYLSMTMYI